jgi:hypothetical protein
MSEEKNEPFDILKTIQGIEVKKKEEELKDALKQLRHYYIGLIESGFTMKEAMTFVVLMLNRK